MSTAESSSGGRTRQWPAQRQQKACKAWKQGNCQKGTQCKNSHEEQDRGTASVGFLVLTDGMLTICEYMRQKPNNSKEAAVAHSKNTASTSVYECRYLSFDESNLWHDSVQPAPGSSTTTPSTGTTKAKPGVGKGQGGTSTTNTSNGNTVFAFDNFPVKAITCKKWKAGKCTTLDCRFRHSDDVRNIGYTTSNLIHINRCVVGPRGCTATRRSSSIQ